MAQIPDHVLAELKERVDIVAVIEKHVGLKRAGKHFKGLCPFHQEKTPSFYVDPHRRSYKCFGCGEWGDAIDFVRKVEGKSFPEAVRTLAVGAGVRLPEQSSADVARAEAAQGKRDAAYALNRLAAEVYRDILLTGDDGARGRAYQQTRGIDAQTAERFRLGYAPAPTEAGWDRLAREIAAHKLDMNLAIELGLVARSERTQKIFDRFRGRLMFPIISSGGAVIGFSGRVLPDFERDADGETAPKYINSPESMLYKKSKSVFGLHAAVQAIRAKKRVVLVEGNVDVVSMHQRGYTETVAPLGTALTGAQCERLARFAQQAVLCFDGDRAGANAMRVALPLLLDAGLEVRVAALPDGEDPDSIDADRLAGLLERPTPGLEWFMRRMVAAGATESIEAKARALRALVPLLRKIKQRDARGDYAVLAANLLEIPVRRIWGALEGSGGGNSPFDRSQGGPFVPDSAPMRAQALPRAQAALTALVVDRPEVARVAERSGALEHVSDPRLQPILRRVIEAALEGEAQPSEGELLELVDHSLHRQLHETIFSGTYLDASDPQALLDQTLQLCDREALDAEIARLDAESRRARQSGDTEAVRDIQQRKLLIRRRQQELLSRSRQN